MQISIYQRFWDPVINIVYPLPFIHLFVLVLFKVQLIKKRLSAIKVFIKSHSYKMVIFVISLTYSLLEYTNFRGGGGGGEAI